jgi:hypothetical protein
MSTIACPFCGHENEVGALLCSKCHAMLIAPPLDGGQLPSETYHPPETLPPPRRHLTRQLRLLGPNAVALYFDDIADPLILDITREAVLGRYSERSKDQPRIDLTQYGGYEKGVSRLHAVLRREGNGLSIEDLGSSNGTFVNSNRLAPYTKYVLKSGDRIKIGQIFVEIYFGRKDHGDEQ